MRVAFAVMSTGAGDVVAGESLSDRVKPGARQVLAEDSLDDRCGFRVGFQSVETFSVGSLRRVGVGAGVGEAVAVGRAAAQVTTFDLGL
ncbi:hypothetical protein N599_18955 [Saccharopolyspora erythraea D]|nr:hypothetical protein N599_18955 [Saccharopolyspora erythraea D]